MPDEATSLHLRSAHELFLLIPLRTGFVEGAERRTSYGTRLRGLLSILYRAMQGVAEKSLMPTASFTDRLETLYGFNYGVVDRMQQSELFLSATFDASWEAYFHNLVDNVGPFLDAVFSHCQGFRGRSCADGYQAFASFIRANQHQTGMVYSATPDLTVTDLRILREHAHGRAIPEPMPSAKTVAQTARAQWTRRHEDDTWQGESEHQRLRVQSVTQLVRSVWELRELFPAEERFDEQRSAQDLYDEAAGLLATSFILDDETYLPNIAAAIQPLDPEDAPKRAAAQAWIEKIAGIAERLEARRPPSIAEQCVDVTNVQDNIVSPCGSTSGVLALLRFPSAGPASFLQKLAVLLREPDDLTRKPDGLHYNVALTYAGLRRSGLGDATLELFPREFREGMEQRAGTLGDVGWPNHPDYWHVAESRGRVLLSSIDVVLLVHAESERSRSPEERLHELLRDWCGEEADSVLVYLEPLWRAAVRDHFGYEVTPERQPVLAGHAHTTAPGDERGGSRGESAGVDDRIAAGDLLLGYRDRRGEVARCAHASSGTRALFKDGTFLVLRKLAQTPAAFAALTQEQGEPPEVVRQDILCSHDASLPSDHDDAARAGAEQCPLFAHVRRANPREPTTPRIVRRSFSYGPQTPEEDPERERGHMFMAYNASIAQQFEVLQRWINGGNSTGVLSTQRDLLAGLPPLSGMAYRGRRGIIAPHEGLVPPVSLRWGMYLFVPSKLGLRLLAQSARGACKHDPEIADAAVALRESLAALERDRLVRRGTQLVARLDGIEDASLARLSWKQLIEEPALANDAEAVWAAIRNTGGRKRTPYGLLVADLAGAETILCDPKGHFSVCEYWPRLASTAGRFYLGMDTRAACPVQQPHCPVDARPNGSDNYAARGPEANHALREAFRVVHPFERAYGHVQAFLPSFGSELTPAGGAVSGAKPGQFDLRDIARQVVGKISADWIGMPKAIRERDHTLRAFLDHFMHITRYSSFPHPEVWLAARAFESGEALRAAYGEDVDDWGGVGRVLLAAGYAKGEATAIRDAVIGANIGFVPPSVSLLINILRKWLSNGDLEHLAGSSREVAPTPLAERAHDDAQDFSTWTRGDSRYPWSAEARRALREEVIREMRTDPTFTSIYRTALEGNEMAPPSSIVVVGVQSAFAEAEQRRLAVERAASFESPEDWLFGGPYGRAAHGCPLREASLAILSGAIAAVADHVRETLARNPAVTLVRFGPTTWGFEQVGRTVHGRDLIRGSQHDA